MLSLGFTPSIADLSFYYLVEHDQTIFALVYVDDIYLFGNNTTKIKDVRFALSRHFDMTGLGLLSHSFGLEFSFPSS